MKHTTLVRGRMIVAAGAALTALSCSGDPAGSDVVGATTAPLVEGRSFPVETDEGPVRVVIGNNPMFNTVLDSVVTWCDQNAGDRWSNVALAEGITDASVIVDQLSEQSRRICLGYVFLGWADGIAPIDLVSEQDPENPQAPARISLRPRHAGPPPDMTNVFGTIPVVSGSDAASLAMLAAWEFQSAGLAGRDIMVDPDIVAIPKLLQCTFPSADTQRVTAGFLLASQTTEAVQMMQQAAERATTLISAAAEQRRALDPSSERARVDSWRATHDSRLEIANLWLGVPEDAFQPDPDTIADGTDAGVGMAMAPLVTAGPLAYPVVTWVPTRASEEHAVALLRDTAVDPRDDGTTTAGDRVRLVLQADHPELFPTTTNTTDFLQQIGIRESELNLAARMLTQEAMVLGDPIVRTTMTEPHRVEGTAKAPGVNDPVVIGAKTGGTLTFDEGEGDRGADSCGKGIFATMECIRDGVQLFVDIPGVTTPAVDELLDNLDVQLHEAVPQTAHVCVGQTTSTDAVESIRLRIRGVPGVQGADAAYWNARMELWWGEEGLRCAQSSPIDACTAHRVTTSPTLTEADGVWTLQWSITPAHVPAARLVAGDIPTAGTIYVTRREAVGRERASETGFRLLSGDSGGSFSRCSYLPIGPRVREVLAEAMAADRANPSRPYMGCAGLDEPLPLEDVFTEAGVAGEFMEAAFLHYLDRAESAAARAEQLGERVIAEEMEMNQMAEGSIDRINQICGTTITANAISLQSPAACGAGTVCPDGAPCESGRCRANALDLIDGDPDDLARLRRCLADESGVVHASLGVEPLCAWETGHELCACPAGEECGSCPRRLDLGACSSNIPAAATAITTRPLGLVTPDVQISTSSVSACTALARLRAGDATSEDVDAIRAGGWLSLSSAQGIAESLSFSESFGGFATIERGGRTWLDNGSLYRDPGTVTPSACLADAMTPSSVCASDALYGPSIRCGWGQCNTEASRAIVARRMHRAVLALDHITGIRSSLEQRVEWGAPNYAFTVMMDLPSWTGANGRIVQRTWQVNSSTTRFGLCVDLAGTSTLDELRWPRCGNAFATAPVTIAVETEDRESAVDRWDPSPPHFGAPAGRIHGMLNAAARGERVSASFGPMEVNSGVQAADGSFARETITTTFTPNEVFDALEMMCASLENDVGGCASDLEELPTITTVEDIDRLVVQIDCAASRFEGLAQRMVLPLPEIVAEDIASGRITGTYPSYSGLYGSEISTLRGQMEGIVGAIQRVARTVRDVGGDATIARSLESSADLQGDMRELQFVSEVSSHLNRCLAALSPTVGSGVSWNTGAVFTCVDSVTQILLAAQMSRIADDLAGEELIRARTETAMLFAGRMDALGDATRDLSESLAAVNATLARMEGLRNEGRRELARSLFLDRDDVQQEWVLGRAIRGRHNRTRAQYEEAHWSAVRLAHLARRAIEQRVGYDLSNMTEPMTLVEAPSTWADTVCTSTGVDYYELFPGSEAELPGGVQTVADYVQRLRMFLDSYMLDYPFENSSDTVVLSLRDDLPDGIGTDCPVRGANLLRDSEALAPGSGGAHWSAVCDSSAGESCLGVLNTTGNAFEGVDAPYSVAPAGACVTRVLGGGADFLFSVTCPLSGGTPACGGTHTAGGGWAQRVELPTGVAGEYVVSWYERLASDASEACAPAGGSPRMQVELVAASANAGGTTRTSIGYLPAVTSGTPTAAIDRWVDQCRWRRVAVHFEVAQSTDGRPPAYDLVLRINNLGATEVLRTASDSTHQMGVAGVALDRVHDDVGTVPEAIAVELGSYFPTDADGMWPVGPCLSRDERDLQTAFRYTCEAALCPDGVGTGCLSNPEFDPDLRTCYWETTFDIGLSDIERGVTIPNGGFAVGNFNYRTESLAVNIVGTAVRDCSEVGTGADGCYGSGYVPFSLLHESGWEIRNHDGDRFMMSIFPGAVVSAKALASERYITNPISSADRSLLTDYWHGEFRGRPLNGHFRLRIHEVPGLDFSNIEDVQLVVGYRFWTRQE